MSPLKTAVIECGLPVVVEYVTVQVAVDPLKLADPAPQVMVPLPSLKTTLSPDDGLPPPGEVTLTVAVYVTVCVDTTLVDGDAARAVVVDAWPTVAPTAGEVEVACVLSPPNTAVTMWVVELAAE